MQENASISTPKYTGRIVAVVILLIIAALLFTFFTICSVAIADTSNNVESTQNENTDAQKQAGNALAFVFLLILFLPIALLCGGVSAILSLISFFLALTAYRRVVLTARRRFFLVSFILSALFFTGAVVIGILLFAVWI